MSEDAMVRIEGLSKDVKSLEYRMDAAEKTLQNISELTTSVKVLAVNMEQMATDQKRMADNLEKNSERIRTLEMQPAETWKLVIKITLTTIVGALVGAGIGMFITAATP